MIWPLTYTDFFLQERVKPDACTIKKFLKLSDRKIMNKTIFLFLTGVTGVHRSIRLISLIEILFEFMYMMLNPTRDICTQLGR